MSVSTDATWRQGFYAIKTNSLIYKNLGLYGFTYSRDPPGDKDMTP